MNGINIHPDSNLDMTKPSERWLTTYPSHRVEMVRRVVAMRTVGIELVCVEKTNHAVVRIIGHERRRWPTILRELETLLKKEVEPSLQVYLEPKQDDSLLRLGRIGAKNGT